MNLKDVKKKEYTFPFVNVKYFSTKNVKAAIWRNSSGIFYERGVRKGLVYWRVFFQPFDKYAFQVKVIFDILVETHGIVD